MATDSATEPAGAPKDNVSRNLHSLFEQLKIIKIVFVDDQAELQIDAGVIFRILAENPGSSEVLSSFFLGIRLDIIENHALLEQVAFRLSAFGADKLQELRMALDPFTEETLDRVALSRLRELVPSNVSLQLLTPLNWCEQRLELVSSCSEDSRTLFFFDQDLDVDDETLDFRKGSDIIKDMADKDSSGFGTKWFCGMLSHTLSKGDEVSTWRDLAIKESIGLRYFMPIAKGCLDDAEMFYDAIYRTLINTYCETMKSLASEAFSAAVCETKKRFFDLDPIDFEQAIVNSSAKEGISELETLMRLYGVIQKDHVKAHILEDTVSREFILAARTVKAAADIERDTFSATTQERLSKLRKEELYEDGRLVNGYNDPLRNGDLFEISGKRWALIAQPCDIMVRGNGKRSREENFKVAFLAPITPWDKTCDPHMGFVLANFDNEGEHPAFVFFPSGTPVNLRVLDLAVLNKDGECKIDPKVDHSMQFISKITENQGRKLSNHFAAVAKKIERSRAEYEDVVAEMLADAIIPRVSSAKNFVKLGSYSSGIFAYQIKRCGRIRDPLATSLLAAYSRYMSRDAYAHDYSKL